MSYVASVFSNSDEEKELVENRKKLFSLINIAVVILSLIILLTILGAININILSLIVMLTVLLLSHWLNEKIFYFRDDYTSFGKNYDNCVIAMVDFLNKNGMKSGYKVEILNGQGEPYVPGSKTYSLNVEYQPKSGMKDQTFKIKELSSHDVQVTGFSLFNRSEDILVYDQTYKSWYIFFNK